MRRVRKPKKFKEHSSLELMYLRLKGSQSWRILRTVVFPVLIIYSIYAVIWGSDENRERITSAAISIQYSAEHLPQFMLNDIEIKGVSPDLAGKIVSQIDMEFPVSIFHIDHELISERLSSIRHISHFEIDPQGGGNLVVHATPAVPVAVWRSKNQYQLITSAGRMVDNLFHPGEEPDLPLVSGDGADIAAAEIPHLASLSKILSNQIIGFIRVGERRWDVMLKSGLLIMLPTQDPIGALQQVIKWEEEYAITSRRISRIDMRLPHHPAFRAMSEEDALLYTALQQ